MTETHQVSAFFHSIVVSSLYCLRLIFLSNGLGKCKFNRIKGCYVHIKDRLHDQALPQVNLSKPRTRLYVFCKRKVTLISVNTHTRIYKCKLGLCKSRVPCRRSFTVTRDVQMWNAFGDMIYAANTINGSTCERKRSLIHESFV